MVVLVGCVKVKEIELACLPGEIVIDESAGLSPDTDYITIIEDRYGNKERHAVTSNPDGSLNIPVEEPEKYNPYAGVFSLEIYTPDDDPVTLDLCGDAYSVVNMRFVHFSGEAPDPVIICNELP